MDSRVFEVDDDPEEENNDSFEEGDSIWTEVASESGAEEDLEKTASESILSRPINPVKPFKKKINKAFSLFLIVALVSILAYLDYVNEFQIKKLISNFQFARKATADTSAMSKELSVCKSGIKQVEAVVHFVAKNEKISDSINYIAESSKTLRLPS